MDFRHVQRVFQGIFFVIVVYEYLFVSWRKLLWQWEVKEFSKILGLNSVFGAISFQILGFLPEGFIFFLG